jgi:hypothetical protein
LENPPLWVWAIIVGAIIASKFIYRWQATKQFAKEQEGTKEFTNNDLYGNIDRRHSANIRAHKYSPKRYYKDYFTVKKKRRE